MHQLLLSLAMVAATSAIAAAQGHPQSHPRQYTHDPNHVALDSATHAALHALLHGEWIGTVTAHHGKDGAAGMSVTYDTVLRVKTGNRASLVTNLSVARDTLKWGQNVDGAACKATAVRTGETVKGVLACPSGERTFVLRRKA